jgi:hypothetical protein
MGESSTVSYFPGVLFTSGDIIAADLFKDGTHLGLFNIERDTIKIELPPEEVGSFNLAICMFACSSDFKDCIGINILKFLKMTGKSGPVTLNIFDTVQRVSMFKEILDKSDLERN